MNVDNIHIKRNDGSERLIEWAELNQLKKDILWIFDENGAELNNSYIPNESFTLPYWEYLLLEGNMVNRKQINFYKEGAIIILLSMLSEYIDIPSGNQEVFVSTTISDIVPYADRFQTSNKNQETLKTILLVGLSIAAEISKDNIFSNEDFKNKDLESFHSGLNWVSNTFIIPYFESLLK